MATLYLDFESGNDANDGTVYANRWKTMTSGATAARIAAGDTIRLAESPDPTSLGQNGTWTSSKLSPLNYSPTSTNATPIVMTLSNHGYSNGDFVTIASHTTNTNANGTWEIANVTTNTFELVGSTGNGVGPASGTIRKITNCVVKLTTAVNATIASTGNRGEGRTAWTASASVTCSLVDSFYKEGDVSDQIILDAGFTTGLAAYKATGTLNLSGYQQISFWIRQSAGNLLGASAISIKLCSDTAGATAVDTLDVPALGNLGVWSLVTINKGSALGSSIQSIAFYVNTDNGTQTFQISNVIACKAKSSADSLTLNSLIGKNTAGEIWWPIQSIKGTRVIIDGPVICYPGDHGGSGQRGYHGTSATVTTYKREPIPLAMPSIGATVHQTNEAGSSGNLIHYSGGWDPADNMATQNGETWIDFRNGLGTAVYQGHAFTKISKLGVCRANHGIYVAIGDCILEDASVTACSTYGINLFTHYSTISCKQANCNSTGVYNGGYIYGNSTLTVYGAHSNDNNGFYNNAWADTIAVLEANNNDTGLYVSNSGGGGRTVITTATTKDNTAYNCYLTSENFLINNLTSQGASTYGVYIVGTATIRNLVSSGNGAAGVYAYTGQLTLQDASITDSTPFSGSAAHCVVYSHNHNTAGVHLIWTTGGTMNSESSVRHTASGLAWNMKPTNTSYITSMIPLVLTLAKIGVAANALVTIKAKMRRTNTGLTMRLVCKGGQIAGVANDVTSSMTDPADQWQELTITFTPTVAGAVEITAEAYGGTSYTGYVDDLTATQA